MAIETESNARYFEPLLIRFVFFIQLANMLQLLF